MCMVSTRDSACLTLNSAFAGTDVSLMDSLIVRATMQCEAVMPFVNPETCIVLQESDFVSPVATEATGLLWRHQTNTRLCRLTVNCESLLRIIKTVTKCISVSFSVLSNFHAIVGSESPVSVQHTELRDHLSMSESDQPDTPPGVVATPFPSFPTLADSPPGGFHPAAMGQFQLQAIRTPRLLTKDQSSSEASNAVVSPTVDAIDRKTGRHIFPVPGYLAPMEGIQEGVQLQEESATFDDRLADARENLALNPLSDTLKVHGTKGSVVPETPYKKLKEKYTQPGEADSLDISDQYVTEALQLVNEEIGGDNLSTNGKRLNAEFQQVLVLKLQGKADATLVKLKQAQVLEHEAYRSRMSKETKALQQRLHLLRILILYARYGDYLATKWTRLSKERKKHLGIKDKDAEPLCTDIVQDLDREIAIAKKDYADAGKITW